MTLFSLPIVLDVVAKASLILAATALVAAALRRASASARHFVWTLGLLSALAAPALSVALPRWELPLVTIASSAAPAARVASAPAEITNSPNLEIPRSAPALGRSGDDAATVTPAATPARRMPSWPAIALFAWAAGASLI